MAVFGVTPTEFIPFITQISAITIVTNPAGIGVQLVQITTTQDHGYKDGLVVRLQIPLEYGAQQFDQQFGDIAVDSPTTFIMSFAVFPSDPFVIPVSPQQVPLVIPIAEDVQFLDSAVVNILT